MTTPSEPLVEGEPASLVLRAVLSFRIKSRHDGLVGLAGTADPDSMAALRRAMTRVEARLRRLESNRPAALQTTPSIAAGEAFDIVARRAMRAYGMTVAPWQHQLL